MSDTTIDDVPVSTTDTATSSTSGTMRNLPFEFRGNASEFFGIWIVNLLLTVLTLGIYSAWAKVRTKRYFYGNTYVDDSAFEYHATPIQILIGRLIAVAAYIVFVISASIVPLFSLLLSIALFFAIPWIINRSLRFNTRMSSYRNVRLGFLGDYWSAFRAYILWPVAGILTLGLLIPMGAKAQQTYLVNNARFGGRPLAANFQTSDFYKIYAIGLLIGLILIVQFAFTIVGMAAAAQGSEPTPGAIGSFVGSYLLLLFGLLFVGVYINTMVTNLVFNVMKLDDTHGFTSKMSPLQVLWITVTNTLAIAFTLGLMYPWTKVRLARYRAGKTSFLAGSDLSEFVSTLEDEDSAIGEEIGEIFDIEIGI